MRLVRQSGECWRFQLEANEAGLLRGLLKKFPFSPANPAQASKSDDGPGAAERQKLLQESLAEQRQELKQLARRLLGEDHWTSSAAGPVLTLTSESREILLQILNDIRLGCWHAVGEPADLEDFTGSPQQLGHRALMDLAGYFEMNLLDPDILS